MQKMKRTLALFVLMVFIIVSTMSGFALPLDLAGHWAEESLQKWSDNGLIEGYVTHINEFNEELEYNDYCLTDYEVYESYCEGSKPLYKIIKCPENYACNKNKCQQITSEKKCETLTNYNNLGFDGVKVTDFFGNVDLQFDYCKNNLLISSLLFIKSTLDFYTIILIF